jgi:hypothetical protein
VLAAEDVRNGRLAVLEADIKIQGARHMLLWRKANEAAATLLALAAWLRQQFHHPPLMAAQKGPPVISGTHNPRSRQAEPLIQFRVIVHGAYLVDALDTAQRGDEAGDWPLPLDLHTQGAGAFIARPPRLDALIISHVQGFFGLSRLWFSRSRRT